MDSSKNVPATAEFASSGFFLLRTPLLPIEDFLKLSQPAANTGGAQAAPGSNRAAARAYLRQWARRPEVLEALWIASPQLVGSLPAWWDDPDSANGQKLERALYRYLARMTARATPFGTFAGCTLGEIADRTQLELGPLTQYRRRTRLDMEYLCNLAGVISSEPALCAKVRFRRNSSLHLAAGQYHHLRGDWHEGARLYRLVATEPSPVLDSTLLRAVPGATVHSLASALVASNPQIALGDAEAYVRRLVESQLLVSELVPPVTGPEPVVYMIEQLEEADLPEIAAELSSIANDLRALDDGGLGAGLPAYEEIVSEVSRLGSQSLLARPAMRPGRLLHVDVVKTSVVARLDKGLVGDILEAVEALRSIQGAVEQTVFDQFKLDFQERYGEREVPLLEELDDEAGVGFENEDNAAAEPLIAGIDFRPIEGTAQDEDVEPGPVLSGRLEELRAGGKTVLELDAALLAELKVVDPLPLPDSFAALGTFFRAEGKHGFYLQSISGPPGAKLLARFCHADERLAECVRRYASAEEALHPGSAVFAEITHLPEGRVGNVVSRPVLRPYEIPFLATPGVPASRQILLSDLTVSVREGRIALRSGRLGCEVLPRLASAHAFDDRRSLKFYKFLCLLQHQGVSSEFGWSWGSLEGARFLPRVVRRNIVLALARWRLTHEAVLELCRGNSEERLGRVEQWRKENNVPRFAFIAEFDNQLLIDFETPLAVETFLEHIRKQSETQLVEMFPPPDALPVHAREGSFVNEMVVPIIRQPQPKALKRKIKAAEAAPSIRTEAAVARPTPALSPGAEWLFAKLYCSPSHADRLLLEMVQPLLQQLHVNSSGACDRWFFVRYGDPHWHLRLRFHGRPQALHAQVLPALLEHAEQQRLRGLLWRLEFDSYEREEDRYGGRLAVAIAETLFQFDSELCVELLPLTLSDRGADLRWQLAFCGVDRLLSGLGFGLEEKKATATGMRATRELDHMVDDLYRRQVAAKFRQVRQTLASLLDDAGGGLLPADAVNALARYSARVTLIRAQLEDLRRAGKLQGTMPDLAMSLAHMHLNRVFRAAHLAQEAVVCDFLARTYAFKLARRGSSAG